MTLNITERTMITKLLESGIVTEVSGKVEIGGFTVGWDLYRRENNYFDDSVKFVAGLGYELESFDSVPEAMDALEDMINKKRKEEAA